MKSMQSGGKYRQYIAVIIFIASISFCVIFLSHGEVLDYYVFREGQDLFMDFFNHISYVTSQGRTRVYDQGYNANFPPFAYLFYGLIGRMLPAGATIQCDASATHPYALLLYVIYCVILILLYFNICAKILNYRPCTLPIVLSVVISNIFIFGVLERGNSTWIVCILLLHALYMRNSNSLLKREISLILIAISASFKVYPAIFGLLYLSDRRYKEAFRLLIYGIVFFFAPFVFFGGTHGIIQFVKNQMILQSQADSLGNINHFARFLGQFFFNQNQLYIALSVFFGAFSIFGIYKEKSTWKRCVLLCGMMIMLPKWSQNYTIIYLSIPLMGYMGEEKETKIDCVYSFLFACIFCFNTWFAKSHIPIIDMSFHQFLIYLAVWLLLVLQQFDSIKSKGN